MRKPVVGEELYLVYSDRRRKGEGFNGKVIKVGRKYFKVIPVGYPEDTHFNMSFEIENWKQKTNYSSDYYLYESEQAYKDHIRRQEWIQEFYRVFQRGAYAQEHMTLEDLEKAGKILGISIDNKDHAESF